MPRNPRVPIKKRFNDSADDAEVQGHGACAGRMVEQPEDDEQSNEADVEGHIIRGQGRTSDVATTLDGNSSNDPRTNTLPRIGEQSDVQGHVSRVGKLQGIADDSDVEVEGHGRRYGAAPEGTDAEDDGDEVEGHASRVGRLQGIADDPEVEVEGHARHYGAAPEGTEAEDVGDEVEGHGRRVMATTDPADDAEGHGRRPPVVEQPTDKDEDKDVEAHGFKPRI